MEFTASLGYSDEVGVLFARKRAHAVSHLNELRGFLGQTSSQACNCADEMLCRFLENNVHVRGTEIKGVSIKQAAKDLEATVRWRHEQNLDGTSSQLCGCEYCDSDPFAHCMFSIGRDRRGWEVFYACAGRAGNKNPAGIERHLVLLLENTFSRQDSPPTHFCILFDLHGFSLSDLDPRVAMRCITTLLKHYPDRAAQVAILDAPFGIAKAAGVAPMVGALWLLRSDLWHLFSCARLQFLTPRSLCHTGCAVFKMAWNLIKTAIDPLSQTKAQMLRGEEMSHYLQSFLHEDQAAFIADILKLRAAPRPESFPPKLKALRRALGPKDAYMLADATRVFEDGQVPAAAATAQSDISSRTLCTRT